MKTGKVKEIIRPYTADIPLSPRVAAEDKITDAIRTMIDADVTRIAVMRRHRLLGVIRLHEALERVGLKWR